MLMKKVIFTITMICFLVAAQAQIRFGALLGYAEQIDLWGLGAEVEVMLNDRISVSPNFFYLFPESMNADNKTSMWEWNLNGRYYLANEGVVNLYGLAGLNYSTIKTETRTILLDEIDHEYNAGLNLGAGLLVRVNNFLPFGEARFTAGSYSQFAFFAGVKYEFGRRYDDGYNSNGELR